MTNHGNFDDRSRAYAIALPGAPCPWSDCPVSTGYGGIHTTNAVGSAAPDAVAKGRRSNFPAEGDDTCGALQAELTLAPGETRELLVLKG